MEEKQCLVPDWRASDNARGRSVMSKCINVLLASIQILARSVFPTAWFWKAHYCRTIPTRHPDLLNYLIQGMFIACQEEQSYPTLSHLQHYVPYT